MATTEKRRVTARTMSGRVVSDGADKTIAILVERRIKHPLYHKIMRRSSKIQAHDENNVCCVGDVVVIEETSPYSKTKFFRVIRAVRGDKEVQLDSEGKKT